jgi:hypothetical protein
MNIINRRLLLNTFIKHETMNILDAGSEENLGFVPPAEHLQFLLEELAGEGHLLVLDGVFPPTYTITVKGIEEGVRLNAEATAIAE